MSQMTSAGRIGDTKLEEGAGAERVPPNNTKNNLGQACFTQAGVLYLGHFLSQTEIYPVQNWSLEMP